MFFGRANPVIKQGRPAQKQACVSGYGGRMIKEGRTSNDQGSGKWLSGRVLTPESRVTVTRDLAYIPGGTPGPRFRLPVFEAGVHTARRLEVPFLYNCEAGAPGHHAHSRDNA